MWLNEPPHNSRPSWFIFGSLRNSREPNLVCLLLDFVLQKVTVGPCASSASVRSGVCVRVCVCVCVCVCGFLLPSVDSKDVILLMGGFYANKHNGEI